MSTTSSPKPALEVAQANALLAEIAAAPTIVNVARAAQKLPLLRETFGKVSLRVACLSSSTFDPLKPSLELQALRANIAADIYVGAYGQYEQELISPASGLSAFQPDVVILAVRLQDVCPAIYQTFNALGGDAAARMVDDWLARLRSALLSFRERSAAHLLIQNYDQPVHPALSLADRTAENSQSAIIGRANHGLDELAASIKNVRVMDYDALVAAHGRLHWQDARTAFFARIPVAPANYWALAGFYVRHLRPLYGLSKKVIVLDADNTLWGGVVGDIGLDGLALGHDYPGNAFVAFQKRLLDLYHRGIILCIASKNQPGTVDEVLEKHPHMVLRAEHFAAMRIDWNHKPDNVRAIAADLNLGVDSFVFMDDSPVECELMRTSLPDVLTIHLPEDPAYYAGILDGLDCFDQWTISAEDRQRGQLYKAEAGRRAMQTSVTDLPTFYRQLEMKIALSVDDPAHVGRASQMTNRTNQFNMHTIRCSEDDVRQFMAAADHQVVTLALADRFGDNGIVGLAVVRTEPGRDGPVAEEAEEWTLHLFLMSCRILGRTVEQTFVGWIGGQARKVGAKRLVGLLKPTSKNQPFSNFYESCGFKLDGVKDGVQRWVWDLPQANTAAPDWFEIAVTQ